ncbi:MAG TPA: hypothetical protein VF824_12845 [Thermoanaerobaculia bacterium]
MLPQIGMSQRQLFYLFGSPVRAEIYGPFVCATRWEDCIYPEVRLAFYTPGGGTSFVLLVNGWVRDVRSLPYTVTNIRRGVVYHQR